jgi:drug/metabolite transporter (DMT)-like permease
MTSTASSPSDDARRLRRGIASMLAGGVLFACGNALAKSVMDSYPATEITFFRYLFSIIPIACLVAAQGGVRVLRVSRPWLHGVRALLGIASTALFYISLGAQPLAQAVGISYSIPLFLTILAIPFLGEQVGIYRWGAVIAGFVGVVVLAQPGSDLVPLGLAAGLGSAAAYATSLIVTRRLTERDSAAAINFWFMAGATLVAALALPFGFTMPTAFDLGRLALIGLTAGMGMYLVTRAFQAAPASLLSSLDYLGLVWASLLDFLLWSHVPDRPMIAGGTVIVASGLFIVFRETRRNSTIVRSKWAAKAR